MQFVAAFHLSLTSLCLLCPRTGETFEFRAILIAEDQPLLGQQETYAEPADSFSGLEIFRDDKLLLAATYWGLIRGSRDVPRRSDLDPGAMPPDILPWIVLIMCEEDRFRYRLVGTGLREFLGRDLTGIYADEMTSNPDYNRYIEEMFRQVRREGRCLYSDTILHTDNDIMRTERFMAPLSKSGSQIDMIFQCQSFESEEKPVTGSNSLLGGGPHMLRAATEDTMSFEHVTESFLDI